MSGGTPAYMAPEEAAGARPSPGSDWYSVGVILYQALTGQVPFDGSVAEVLARKRQEESAAAFVDRSRCPANLSAACMQLLSREPARRLKGAAALLSLDGSRAGHIAVAREAVPNETPFVGRERELGVLRAAASTIADDRGGAVAVYGPSGIGKSALVHHFLAALEDDTTVVLAGRCYESETVPFKALDGVVDALSRRLASMPSSEVEMLLTPDVVALTRLFPVLLEVRHVAAASQSADHEPVEPVQLRRRAVDALRDVLARMVATRLIVWIDDLQWADGDSTLLLEELLASPGAAGMLTLLSFRSEELAGKSYLRALVDRGGRGGWTALRVEPMTAADSHALAAGLMPLDHAARRTSRG